MKKFFILVSGVLLLSSCGNSTDSSLSTNEQPASAIPTPTASSSSYLTPSPSSSAPNQSSIVIPQSSAFPIQNSESSIQNRIVHPVQAYGERKTLKTFGEYINDRFIGYHVADDIEFTDTDAEIPVYAIADGTIEIVDTISGYGGVIRILHPIDGKNIHAIYGHIALASTPLKPGDRVKAGDKIAILGKGESEETDGERKHLHFGLYEGNSERINGYEKSADAVKNWINPQDFFNQYQVSMNHNERTFDPAREIGGNEFKLNFSIPADWEVEYIPSIKALNLHTMAGEGTARERSQVLIRFFDASQFLTLTTVNVLKTDNLKVGKDNYEARRYEIEKKAGVANFADQPLWRNEKHIVTDFRDKTGQTRYYVVAKNPELSEEQYQTILASMKII